MKKITILILFALVSMTAEAYALTGIGFGIRAGAIANYDNPELAFENAKSVKIDNLSLIGGHVRFSRFPIVTLELVAERSWRDKEFEVAGLKLEGKVEDFMVAANVKYMLKIPVVTPYIGGGIGRHKLVYTYGPDDVLNENKMVIPEDGTRIGVHALAGVALNVPTSPIEVFLEGRIGTISGENETTKYSAIYGGVTLKLL